MIWKPSITQTLAAYLTMQCTRGRWLPPGVINLVTGDGLWFPMWALADPRLAGIHFTVDGYLRPPMSEAARKRTKTRCA